VACVKVPGFILEDVINISAAEDPAVVTIVLLWGVDPGDAPQLCGEWLSDSVVVFILEVSECGFRIDSGLLGVVGGVQICNGASREVNADAGPVCVGDVDWDEQHAEQKDVVAGAPVGPGPDTVIGVDIAVAGVVVVGLEQCWEKERGVDVAPGIGDLK
jgi:hypothetical protein